MAITVAQDLATQNGAVGTSLTFSGITATAAGSLLVADIGMRLSTTPSTTVVTVTDNKGNAWQPAVVNDPAGLQTSAEIWFCPNAIAGVTSIQVTVGSAASMVLRFYEVTATGTVIWTLDRTSTATASSTAPDSGATSTTTQASEIVIASIVWATAVTISGLGPAGYTVDATNVNSTGNAVNGQNGYQVVSAQASFDFAGTLSGAHAWVASVATFKPVPPSPLSGQTPVARAPYNPAGQSPDDLNQLLGTHSTVSCWDNATAIASPSVVQFGGFQPLASASGPVAVSQGVSVAGGTIDRVVLPLSIASGIGADVTVGLYADSGGSPAGPPIAQVLVPREALAVPAPVAASQGGPAAFGAQLMTSWRQQSVFVAAGTPSLTAVGTTLIALGGDLAGVKVATVYTATAADQSVGPWAVAPVLPDVRQFAGTCCTPHYVVVTGGIDNTVYHNTVWTASVDANGNLGAWTVQTALPVPLALHAAVYSNGWVYLIGGYTTGTVAQATVYAGAIDANGQVLGWNALGGLPVAMGAPAAGIVNGHLVVVAGGNTSGGTPAAWLAPVLAPGQLGAFRPIAAPPTWIADPTSTVVGDTLFVGGGTAGVMYSLQVSPTGDVGPWITQPAISPAPSAISVMASLGSTVYLIGTPGANVLTADSNRVPTISVPLHATGLAAATYDIVVSLAGPNDPNNSPQVGLSSGASSLPFAESKAGTAAWVGANDQLPANESGTSITTGWGDSTANATVAYAGGAIVLTSLAAGTMECAHFLAVTPNTDYTLQASAEASATGRSCQLNIIWYDANENQLASLSSGLVDTTGVFTAAAVTAASPPNAAFAFLSLEVFGTAAAGEVHRWTSLFWGEPSTVPLSVYASGNMSRLVHVLSDVQHGAPQEWGALAYNFWGQPVQYLEVVQPLVNLLSPNASSFGGPVQGTTAAWTPTNCTLAVVTPPVPPPVGFYNTQIAQYAMSLTSVGAGTMSVSTGLSGIPCDAGVTYTASADFLAVTVARSTTVGLAFYDASGTQIGSTTTGAAVADATTAWQAAPPFVTVAAPAGAATMAVVLSIAATAGAGEVHDVDLVIARVGQSAQYVAPGLGPGGLHVLRTLTYDPTSGQLVSLT